MRLTVVLFRQHIGYHLKKHWIVQGKRSVRDLGASKILKRKGIPVYHPKDILELPEIPRINEVPDYIPQAIKYNKEHPNWHSRKCYTYKDNNVLLEGLNQAKIITKTIELQEGLPKHILMPNISTDVDRKVRRIILNSHLFDAEQQKLPRLKDESRPAWNFPRQYGITEQRTNNIITSKLLHLIEMISAPDIVRQRCAVNDLTFWYPFEKAGDLFQLQLTGETLITTSKPLSPVTSEDTESVMLPNIYPVEHLVTLNPEHIYTLRNIYPIDSFIQKSHPHTLFINYNHTEVKNLFEEDVTEFQILGRSLLKTFAVAASYAKSTFGQDVGVLPKPVTVQCVHTDGRMFHFGILQLNTLNLEEGGIKNVWYHIPTNQLFTSCAYKLGKPVLEGYNSDIIKHLVAFYNHV